jgi:hypothetical protein
MGHRFAIVIGGKPAIDLDSVIVELEVEENADLPSAFSITLPVTATPSGDYDTVSDRRLGPASNIAVTAQAADGVPHCLIDGYVLAHDIHLDAGTARSTVKVWGQDGTWRMNITERVREWVDVTDGDVADSIFGDYGFGTDPRNRDDDSPAHTEDGHSLMQRATDAQFLRMLARRNGKLFRVYCTGKPGVRTGAFVKPSLDGAPAAVLTLNDSAAATIGAIDIAWDVMRPTGVLARQALFTDNDRDGAGGTTTDPGLAALGDRTLSDFATSPVTTLLTTTVDDGVELTARAQSLLREAGWFVRCKGTADVARLGTILRAGTVARLDAAGTLHSGRYLVWSVRHHITQARHTMDFVLLRNAVGAAASAPASPF